MSVRALFPKGKEPRYVLEVLIRTLPEASLHFTQDGISLKALDPTKTAMFELTFHSTGLEDYMVEEEAKIGLIFTTIKEVVKRVGTTEKLELEVDKERNRFSLYIYPKGGKAAGFVRRFSFPVVSVVEEEIPELSISFEASFEIDTAALADVLAAVKEVSDWVQISVSPDVVMFKGAGEGGKVAEAEFGLDSEAVFNISTEKMATAKYSVEILKDVNDKLKSISKRVRVELSSQKPIKLTYEFSTGMFAVVIAPRVD
ncbi:MAG: DNA polymerase sliding clamp [Pyrobaculum sp.]